jgi:hypothetical protein
VRRRHLSEQGKKEEKRKKEERKNLTCPQYIPKNLSSFSETIPFALGMIAVAKPDFSARRSNASRRCETRSLTPPTRTGFTALLKSSSAVSTAASREFGLVCLSGSTKGMGSRSKVGWGSPAMLQAMLM